MWLNNVVQTKSGSKTPDGLRRDGRETVYLNIALCVDLVLHCPTHTESCVCQRNQKIVRLDKADLHSLKLIL